MARVTHRARVLIVDGYTVDECTVCGREVEGYGDTLRHIGEPTPTIVPDPEDARAVAEAIEDAEAVARTLGKDTEFARAVVETLYARGRLRRRRGERRHSALLDEPRERLLDHAERAAGERLERVPA